MLATPIEVKKAYKEGTHKKNYRFVVLNDDGTEDFTIDNDTLVAESVHIDERMATGSELKFGLCEGSSLEFQYFDHPNINGRTVQAFIDIYYDDVNTHSTPMGYFTVKECPRQFSTGIYKVTAYNKLMSEYLDAKANDLLLADFGGDGSTQLTIFDIQRCLLSNYEILERPQTQIDLSESLLPPTSVASQTSFALTQVYGIDTPLSGKEWEIVKGSQAYAGEGVRIGYSGKIWDISGLTNYYWTLSFIQGDIEVFVDNLINYIADVIENSQLHSTLSTREQIISEIKSWSRLFYVSINGTNYNLLDNPKDKLDTINKTIKHGINYVSITIPSLMGFQPLNSTSVGYLNIAFDNAYQYSYYIDSSLQTRTKTTDPDITFSTGRLYYGDCTEMFKINLWELSDAEQIQTTINDLPEFTLRDIVSANYETQCQFGQLDRQTDLFSGVELNGGGLYPAETLYPADGLYPNSNTGGQGIHPYPSEYSQLWTDTMGEQSFRYLIITYKTLDENNQEVDAVLQRTVNADGTTDYNMSDNWLFRNLVWTAADVGDYADAMVLKMHNIRWFPFEMWAAGLPYVETGDAIEITDREGNTHNSYILQRQLQGIQNLQDTYVNGELDIF